MSRQTLANLPFFRVMIKVSFSSSASSRTVSSPGGNWPAKGWDAGSASRIYSENSSRAVSLGERTGSGMIQKSRAPARTFSSSSSEWALTKVMLVWG